MDGTGRQNGRWAEGCANRRQVDLNERTAAETIGLKFNVLCAEAQAASALARTTLTPRLQARLNSRKVCDGIIYRLAERRAAPLLGLTLFAGMIGAAAAGYFLRRYQDHPA